MSAGDGSNWRSSAMTWPASRLRFAAGGYRDAFVYVDARS